MKRMQREVVVFASQAELEADDKQQWQSATVAERLETITFLRECFYGDQATTGRLSRVYRIIKRE